MIVNGIIAILLPTAFGYLATTALLQNNSRFLERLSLSYPLGAGFLTMIMFYVGLVRIPFNIYIILLPMIAVSIYMIYYIKKKNIRLFNLQMDGFNTFLRERSYKQILIAVLFVWILFKIILIFFVSLTLPIWSPDSWLNWSTRAFVFFQDKGLYLHPEDFFAKSVGQYTYPPHNSLLQVWLAMWMGTFDRVLVKLWVPLYLVSAALFLYTISRKHFDQLRSGIVVLIFISSPLMMIHATEPYSDMIVGLYILFALASFWRLINNEKAYSLVCGIFSAQAFFVKNEAMIFVFALIATFFIWFIKEKEFKVSCFLPAYYLAPFLSLIPYIFFKTSYNIGFRQTYYGDVKDAISFHSESLKVILLNLWQTIDNFNFIVPVMLISCIFMFIFKIQKKLITYIILPVVLYILFFFVLYIFNDAQARFLMEGTIFFRNFMTYYPALFFITYLLFNSIYVYAKNMSGVNHRTGR